MSLSLRPILCLLLCSLGVASSLGADTLTNADVIRLVQAGLADATIIEKITTARCAFDLDTDGLINLKQAGVSDAIITAMLTTHERAAPPPPPPTRKAPPPVREQSALPTFQEFTLKNVSQGRLFSRVGFVRFSADGVAFYYHGKPDTTNPYNWRSYSEITTWSHTWSQITRVCFDGKMRLNVKLLLRSGSIRLFDIGDFHDWSWARANVIDDLREQQRNGVAELQHMTLDYNCDKWKR